MYTIVVSDSNELTTTISERIIRKSNLVDCLHFLVEPLYKNSINMRKFNVRLDYILPISQDHHYMNLILSKCLYKGMLEYRIPFSKKLTSEAGDLKIWLTFTRIVCDDNGNKKQLVRRTTPTIIPIFNCENNCDAVLDPQVATYREVDDAFDHLLHKFWHKKNKKSEDLDGEETDDDFDDDLFNDEDLDDEGSDGYTNDDDDNDVSSQGYTVFTDKREPDGTVVEI